MGSTDGRMVGAMDDYTSVDKALDRGALAEAQLQELEQWFAKHMPQVSMKEGPVAPAIRLLDISLLTVQSVFPVAQSIIASVTTKMRDAGLMRGSQ